jgi:hypothetical protein
MSKIRQRPQDMPALRAWRAHRIAVSAWALAALAPGVAAGLAQYASLAAQDPSQLNKVALIIACTGPGVALIGWLYWAIVQYRLHQIAYRAEPIIVSHALISFIYSLVALIAGAVIAAQGGNSDSLSPLALIALGLGISCVIGGLLGIVQTLVVILRLDRLDAARRRENRARLRAAAEKEGWEIREPAILQIIFGLGGVIAGIGLMASCAVSGPLLAHSLNLHGGGRRHGARRGHPAFLPHAVVSHYHHGG